VDAGHVSINLGGKVTSVLESCRFLVQVATCGWALVFLVTASMVLSRRGML